MIARIDAARPFMKGCLRDRVEVDDLTAVLVFVRRGILAGGTGVTEGSLES